MKAEIDNTVGVWTIQEFLNDDSVSSSRKPEPITACIVHILFTISLAVVLSFIHISTANAIPQNIFENRLAEIDKVTRETRSNFIESLELVKTALIAAEKEGRTDDIKKLIDLKDTVVRLFNDALETSEKEKTSLITDYLSQHIPLPGIGSAFCNASSNSRLSPGNMCELTFGFIDPATGFPVEGPDVGFVIYEVRLDPELPEAYSLLAISDDSGSNFNITYLLSDFDPLIRATPFSLLGDPILIAGVDSLNVAVGFATVTQLPVPIPPALSLIALGLLVLARQRCRVI